MNICEQTKIKILFYMLLTFSIIINNIVFIILLFEFFSLHGSELKLTLYMRVRKSWLKICFFFFNISRICQQK